jgi:hypothetical protein
MLVRPPLGELDLAQITSAVVRYQAKNNRDGSCLNWRRLTDPLIEAEAEPAELEPEGA